MAKYNIDRKKLNQNRKVYNLIVAGLIVLIISLILKDGIIRIFMGTISSYLIVSGILDLLNKQYNDDELINKVCDCIGGETEATKLGVTYMTRMHKGLPDEIINNANKIIDIMHVYGSSWTGSNRMEIINALNRNVKIRVIIVDYRSELVKSIYNNQYQISNFRDKMKETIKIWQGISNESKHSENLRVYFYDGFMTNAIYLNELNVVALHFASHKARLGDDMTILKCKNSDNGFYQRYKNEIENVISESIEININTLEPRESN